MFPTIKFVPNNQTSRGLCSYNNSDLTLSYELMDRSVENPASQKLSEQINQTYGIDTVSPILIIADTLTLVFASPGRALVSLDAYTNNALWEENSLPSLPIPISQGSLCVENCNESDRYTLSISPKYEVSPNSDWVRVSLSDPKFSKYYDIGSNLRVGLSEGQITELFLRDVQYI